MTKSHIGLGFQRLLPCKHLFICFLCEPSVNLLGGRKHPEVDRRGFLRCSSLKWIRSPSGRWTTCRSPIRTGAEVDVGPPARWTWRGFLRHLYPALLQQGHGVRPGIRRGGREKKKIANALFENFSLQQRGSPPPPFARRRGLCKVQGRCTFSAPLSQTRRRAAGTRGETGRRASA